MKILFIQKNSVEHYGIMILSSILKNKKYETNILITDLEKNIKDQIKKINPDAIALTAISSQNNWLIKITKVIKNITNCPIILGGPHATFYPSIIKRLPIKYLVRGEAEIALPLIIKNIKSNSNETKIPNTWIKTKNSIIKNNIEPAIENLDIIPFADRKLYHKYHILKKNPITTFMASRGCPYDCAFCFNKQYNALYNGKSKIFRKRSVQNLITEIKNTIKITKPKTIVFDDDTFLLLPPEWVTKFCKEYKKITKIPFSINARANIINEKTILKLKTAGCNLIRIGIESFDPSLREKILKKGITNQQIIKANNIIKKHKIMIQYYFILGTPGENLQTALETYNQAKKINPTFAWCSLMAPYPGTEIARMAKEKKLIKNSIQLDNSFFNTLTIEIPNKKEIIRLQKLFQFGNIFKIPKTIINIMIKLPLDIIYNLIFKIFYALALKKLYKFSFLYIIQISLIASKFIKKDN